MKRASVIMRILARPTGIVAAMGLLTVILAAILGPEMYHVNPMKISRNTFIPPGVAHPMGTDHLGREILAQFLAGARSSLFVGITAAIIATTIGITVGGAAGYYSGRVDDLLMRITEFFQTIPIFFLAIIAVAFVGPSLTNIIMVIGFLAWPKMARVTRSQFLAIKEREFIEASRAVGASGGRLVFKGILPNALPPITVISSLLIAEAILLEAYLGFLGMGDPSVPSWGMMLYTAQQYLFQAWWMMAFPGFGIFISVLCFNLLGDALNDVLNPLTQSKRAAIKTR